jgi:hypothetical protein
MKRFFASAAIVAIAAVGVPVATAATTSAAGGNNANAKLCQKNGWQNLQGADGTKFASEEQCVSYAAQGGTLVAAPYVRSRQACESYGGTFTLVLVAPQIWTCDGLPDSGGFLDLFNNHCVPDGGTTFFWTNVPAFPANTLCT